MQSAKSHFDAVMNGRTTLPIADWQKEQRELAAKRYAMCDEYYALQEEVPNMEAIRRSIDTLMHEDLQKTQPMRAHGVKR